jgi:hypothetical protein
MLTTVSGFAQAQGFANAGVTLSNGSASKSGGSVSADGSGRSRFPAKLERRGMEIPRPLGGFVGELEEPDGEPDGGMIGVSRTAVEVEGIRKGGELYLGINGRHAFNDRSILERRTIQQPCDDPPWRKDDPGRRIPMAGPQRAQLLSDRMEPIAASRPLPDNAMLILPRFPMQHPK